MYSRFVKLLFHTPHRHFKMDLITKHTSIHDDYKIEGTVLGFGISGKVLTCVNKKTNVRYALKTLSDKKKSKNEIELHLKACRDCPYIAKIVDIYENVVLEKNVYLVVIELIPGGQLFEMISTRKTIFTEKEVAKIMSQICTAVKHLHDLNIAHRDLKPENLLLTSKEDDAVVKLIDFGFSKENNLGLNTPCYTPYYVAPEVLKYQKYDKSCDIWSLGVIMYILCCGYPPFYSFHGYTISPGMKKRIKEGRYDFPDKEWKNVSKEAIDLISSMLEINPEKRITINEIINSKWLIKMMKTSNEHEQQENLTELSSIDVLKNKEKTEWENETVAINTALNEMRIDSSSSSSTFKMDLSMNKLYKKRIQKNEN